MRKLEVPNQSALLSALKKAACQSPETAFLHRLHGLFLLSLGFSCYQVADWFGKNPKTLERWVHGYEKRGAEGLRAKKKPGRKGSLSQAQLETLTQDLMRTPRAFGYEEAGWSGRLLASHLEKRLKVALSLRQCQRLLKQWRGCGRIVAQWKVKTSLGKGQTGRL